VTLSAIHRTDRKISKYFEGVSAWSSMLRKVWGDPDFGRRHSGQSHHPNLAPLTDLLALTEHPHRAAGLENMATTRMPLPAASAVSICARIRSALSLLSSSISRYLGIGFPGLLRLSDDSVPTDVDLMVHDGEPVLSFSSTLFLDFIPGLNQCHQVCELGLELRM
jgi:hypothetical protein